MDSVTVEELYQVIGRLQVELFVAKRNMQALLNQHKELIKVSQEGKNHEQSNCSVGLGPILGTHTSK